MHTALVLAVAAVAALTLAPAPAGAIFVPDLAFVPIQNMVYFGVLGPVAVVASGGTVVWENHEYVPGFELHTATADDGSFDSGDILLHNGFSVVIDAPSGSVITYHCAHHAFMVGFIVVQ